MSPVPEAGLHRAGFLRRAGAGAAGLSLAELLGPPAALAADGGGDFAAHPHWRFVFVSHDTVDPLLVATQFGAQDAAALVKCSVRVDGLAARQPEGDRRRRSARRSPERPTGSRSRFWTAARSRPEIAPAPQARRSRSSRSTSMPGSGQRSPTSGRTRTRIGRPRRAPRSLGSSRASRSCSSRPSARSLDTAERLEGVRRRAPPAAEGSDGDGRAARGGPREASRTAVEAPGRGAPASAGCSRSTARVRSPSGRAIERSGSSKKGVHGGGYDLLPGDLALVADGPPRLRRRPAAVLQGFEPVSAAFPREDLRGDRLLPWDTETSVLLRRDDVGRFLATKSRFEGSSSRHEFPLRRD